MSLTNVQTGAALLDRERPGWEQKIDSATLDLNTCTQCILAQVFGSYQAGVAALVPTLWFEHRSNHLPWVFAHGFSVPTGDPNTLIPLWREEIASRLKAD